MNTASRRVIGVMLCALMLTSTGCAAILEGDTYFEAPHTRAPETVQPGNAPEASNYGELMTVLLELVSQRAESGQILVYSYEGDIYEDIVRACDELKTSTPIGEYALSDITASVTQIVSYFEIDAELTYKRTKKQMDAIISVTAMPYFRTRLLGFMSDYINDVVVLTESRDITEDKINEAVRELYYENPLSVIMLPTLGIEIFPKEHGGGQRIFELTFNYRYSASLLASYNRQLRETVSNIVRMVKYSDIDNDGRRLLALAQGLAESCVYNEMLASRIAEHGMQSFEVTAFGALMDSSAVGEGYAMAYKALCDEIGIECHVVLGMLDGVPHAWNIVALEDEYYHVDVAMCSKNGMETAFLLRDDDLPEQYQWDRRSAETCEGELTYYDFAGEITVTEDT